MYRNQPLRVLIVDAEPDVRDLLKAEFDDSGFMAYTAEDYAAAIQKMNANHIDYIIANIDIAPGGGIKLLEYIKNQHMGIMQVIMMCSRFDQALFNEIWAKGADAVLSKPLDFDLLIDHIRRAHAAKAS